MKYDKRKVYKVAIQGRNLALFMGKKEVWKIDHKFVQTLLKKISWLVNRDPVQIPDRLSSEDG